MKSYPSTKMQNEKLIAVICAFFTTFGLALNLNIISEETISNTIVTANPLVRFVAVLYFSTNGFGIPHLIILIALYLFYKNVFSIKQTDTRQKILAFSLSVILALFLLIGSSYHSTNSVSLLMNDSAQIGKCILVFCGYAILFYAFLKQIWYWFDTIVNKSPIYKHTGWTDRLLKTGRASFIRSFIIILICYLPYIIVAYPACFMGDTPYQLYQIYGLDLFIDAHPVCHTLFLSGCLKLGWSVFHSTNIGLFIYSLLQCFIMIFALSYSIYRIAQSRFSCLSLPVLAYYSLMPFFQMYSMLITKDAIWAPMVLLWTIEFLDILADRYKENVSNKSFIRLFILSTLVCFFRKNGIYLFILSIISLVFVLHKQQKRMLAFLVCSIVFFEVFSKICLPIFHVEAGSRKEMLSIPFQQTARYVCTYPDEVTMQEKETINKILDYDSLINSYNPTLSDPVKNSFNENATSKELQAYFKVWFQMLKKHPGTYISATINNYYDYFYFAKASLSYRTYWSQSNMDIAKEYLPPTFQETSHYYDSDFINELRNFIIVAQNAITQLPGVSLLITSAVYQWIMLILIGYIIAKKQYRYLVAYVPMLSILLVNLAGPTNGSYFRYEYPIAMCLPYIVIWTLHWIGIQHTPHQTTGHDLASS